MMRFYRKVGVAVSEGGYGVVLDGRPVRTPGRHVLELPTESLAGAVAEEWRAQADEIVPGTMPLTQLANTAIDRTRPHRTAVIEQISAYGETDLLCYRASGPPDLATLQADRWQPVLDWLTAEYSAPLQVTADIAPVEQSRDALLAIFSAVARYDDFGLTGLHSLTTASGSVALGLAMSEGRIDAEEGWSLAQLDELYQVEKWGDDPEAQKSRTAVREIIAAATTFVSLARAE